MRALGNWTHTRQRLEAGFETWGHYVAANPWRILVASLLAVAALGSQIPKLEFETSTESFLEPDAPPRIAYEEFREQFGREDAVLLAIETSEVFQFDFLERLRALHEQLEDEVPHLDEVTSLVNVRNTRGEGDRLIVDDFLEDWPETDADLAVLRERALAHPLYRGVLLSDDATLATVMVRVNALSSLGDDGDALAGFDDDAASIPERTEMLTGPESSEFVAAIEAIVAQHDGLDFKIHAAGQPILTDLVMRGLLSDMGRFTALSIAIIAAFLGLLFRSGTAVILALATAMLSVICGFGVMAATGTPLSSPTQVTPSFLLAVAVGNSVHLLAIFFQQRGKGQDVPAALAYSLGHSGLAIVMTGLTTAGSLASFLSAELALIADFGLVAPAGTMIALALSLTFLPAAMAIVPMRTRPIRASAFRRLPVVLGTFGNRHAKGVAFGWAVFLALAFVAALQVRFSNYALDWFKPHEPFRIATELVDKKLGGANSIEVVIDTGHENGLYEPELLRRIEALEQHAEGHAIGTGFVKSATLSVVQVTKETHQALNGNQPDYYVLPDNRRLIAQELLLFENSGTDDLEDIVDSQFQIGRVSLPIPLADSVLLAPLVVQFEREFAEIIGDAGTTLVTGQFKIGAAVAAATVTSLARTYMMAFAVITPFMMVLLGSVRTGLLSMIPAMGAILVTVGAMGVLQLPLDGFTLLVGSIALGLAVDDTIHFMHNFARARARGAGVEAAVRTTLESTGQALFFTSLVLAAGFLIYTQARLNLLFNFGLMTALAISMAFLANVTLAPALVTLVAQLRGEAGSSQSDESNRLPADTPASSA